MLEGSKGLIPPRAVLGVEVGSHHKLAGSHRAVRPPRCRHLRGALAEPAHAPQEEESPRRPPHRGAWPRTPWRAERGS
eukprot:140434-Alexandrium_andersonii.AAC.1